MKIVLATPLYPPDIAEPAPYVKELARRLSKSHRVTVVAYGRLPERIPGVAIIAIDKRRPLPLRLLSFWSALRRAGRDADVVYAENGSSVELPLIFTAGTPCILHIGDRRAHAHAKRSFLRKIIEVAAFSRARNVRTNTPPAYPEIHPLEPEPIDALRKWEHAWELHIAELEILFDYAKR